MSDRERKKEVAVQGAPACKRSEISRRGSCFSSTTQVATELSSTPNPGQARGAPRRQRPQRQGGVTATTAQLAAGPGSSRGSRNSQPQRGGGRGGRGGR